MNTNQACILVLWGDWFDEAAAAIFVTTLRETGLRVKVVGLSGRPSSGAHGLALSPDLTLDQALPLAGQAVCVVIPYPISSLRWLMNDPRVPELLRQAAVNRASVVVGESTEVGLNELAMWPFEQVLVYPGRDKLVDFARALGGTLSTMN